MIVLAIVFMAIVNVLILSAIVRNCSDSYRGHYRIKERVRDAQSAKWLHDHCHKGSGRFCDTCLEYAKCTKECEAQVKKEIDEYIEHEEGGAK